MAIKIKKFQFHGDSLLLWVLAFLVISANLIASLWNVDPYHEGAIFPTASGIAQGLNVFSQVSNQYGFLLPLTIAPFLKIFGSYLYISRLVSFSLLLLTSFLTFKVAIHYVDRKVASYASLLWLGVSPIWSFTTVGRSLSGGVWPNHLAIIMVLIALLFLISESTRSTFYGGAVAGFLTLLSSQARMEFVLVWLFISIFLAARDRVLLFRWTFGSVIAILLTIAYLDSVGSLTDWFDQTIRVWTLHAPDVPAINLSFFISNGLNFLVLAAILPMFVLFHRKCLGTLPSWLRISLSTFFMIVIASIVNFIPLSLLIFGKNISTIFQFAAQRSLFSYVNVAISLSIVVMCLWLTRWRIDKRRSSTLKLDINLGLLWSTALGVLGIFHNTNADYTSITVAPFLIIALSLPFSNSAVYREDYFKLFREIVSAIVIASIAIFLIHFPSQSHSYKTPVLKHLFAQNKIEASQLDERYNQILRYTKGSSFLMDCQTGMLSVNENGFKGLDKWTWNQQPESMLAGRLQKMKPGEYVVACHVNEPDTKYLSSPEGVQKLSPLLIDGDFRIYRVN